MRQNKMEHSKHTVLLEEIQRNLKVTRGSNQLLKKKGSDRKGNEINNKIWLFIFIENVIVFYWGFFVLPYIER